MNLLYLIPFLTALNGINFKLAGLNIRLDQLVVVFLIFVIAAIMLLGKLNLYLDKVGKLLLIYFLWSFVVSYLFAPDVKYCIIQTINILSAASIYFVMTNLLRSGERINKYFKFYLWAGIVFILYGIIIYILSLMGFNIYGANLPKDAYSIAYGVFATMREPNIFGSFSLIYFVLSFVIIVSLPKTERKYNNLLIFLLLTSAFGMFLSFTRGVWLAALIGIIATFAFNKKKFKIFRHKTKYIFLVCIFLVIVLIFAELFVSKSVFYYKISNFLDYKGGTGAGRIGIWKTALENIKKSPIFGHGTYSFATFFSSPWIEKQESLAWIGNIFITLLHDTGIIGTLIFLWMIKVLLKRGIRTAKKIREIDPMNSAIILGFCISLACLLIAFVFTTGFSYVYAWSVLGFIGVYVRYEKQLELRISIDGNKSVDSKSI
jgi:O-antigen ligase